MPFINSKVTVKLSENQKESLKAQLGQAITCIPGKSEGWLMVGIEDEYCLYFQGNQNAPAAFVEVKIFGHASAKDFDRMTAKICEIYEKELGIPQNRIYVTYEEVENWGWNGGNF